MDQAKMLKALEKNRDKVLKYPFLYNIVETIRRNTITEEDVAKFIISLTEMNDNLMKQLIESDLTRKQIVVCREEFEGLKNITRKPTLEPQFWKEDIEMKGNKE